MSFLLSEAEGRYKRYSEEGHEEREREFGEMRKEIASVEVPRYEYGRDYDRILYSSAIRKLGGVTQVVTSQELGMFHNRLTHSLKVAQTGVRASGWILRHATQTERTRIQQFGGLSPSVVRAACLAHDLGHPPFGHIGEYTLKAIVGQPSKFIPGYPDEEPGLRDLFEGNAQSFRIVTRLAYRQPQPEDGAGGGEIALNLTRATLSALSKYPWIYGEESAAKSRKKWGAYDTERTILEWAFEGICEPRETTLFGKPHRETRSIEGQVMDWADDIAYAVHDLEDFFRVGLIPLNEIAQMGHEYNDFLSWAYSSFEDEGELPFSWDEKSGQHSDTVITQDELSDIIHSYRAGGLPGVFANAPKSTYVGSRSQRQTMHAFASGLIQRATSDLTITKDGVVVPADPSTHVVISVLKKLTERYVIHRPALGSAQVGQRQILIELVGSLWNWVDGVLTKSDHNGIHLELPPRLQDYLKTAQVLEDLQGQQGEAKDKTQGYAGPVRLRAIADYVASLTDVQAISFHERLCLGRTHSMLDPWLFV